MFNRHQDEWHLICARYLDVPFCLRQFGDTIRQKIAQVIARYDQDSEINLPLKQFLSKMDEIHRKQIAPP